MSYYSGIDIHSNNHVVVVMDKDDNKLVDKHIVNDLDTTSSLLSPYKNELKP
jgi:transposase